MTKPLWRPRGKGSISAMMEHAVKVETGERALLAKLGRSLPALGRLRQAPSPGRHLWDI